jgi:hypothetical protein
MEAAIMMAGRAISSCGTLILFPDFSRSRSFMKSISFLLKMA